MVFTVGVAVVSGCTVGVDGSTSVVSVLSAAISVLFLITRALLLAKTLLTEIIANAATAAKIIFFIIVLF